MHYIPLSTQAGAEPLLQLYFFPDITGITPRGNIHQLNLHQALKTQITEPKSKGLRSLYSSAH